MKIVHQRHKPTLTSAETKNMNFRFLQLLLILIVTMDTLNCDSCFNTLAAVENGHLGCLKYFHINGCPWDKMVCSYAALHGHLDCLEYAHTNGCPWDTFTCSNAAMRGHLACLEYAHTNGCPWDESTCTVAVFHGHRTCLEYVHANGCPCEHRKVKKTYPTDIDTESNDRSNECGVCFDKENRVKFIPCNHMFCASCSNRLIITNASCPYCRGDINDSVLID